MTDPDTPHSTSEARINANRENAKKSTGPRTAEGKEASSRNGLLHGLCAEKHILPGEDPDEFLLLVGNLVDRFRPGGIAEEKLVLRIAAGQWRLDRAHNMEAALYLDHFYDVAMKQEARERQYASRKKDAEEDGQPVPDPPAPPGTDQVSARAFTVDCSGPNAIAKLARYETSIERSIDRCIRQLKVFQAARSTPEPGPAALQKPSKARPRPRLTSSKTANYEANYEANPKSGSPGPHPLALSPAYVSPPAPGPQPLAP